MASLFKLNHAENAFVRPPWSRPPPCRCHLRHPHVAVAWRFNDRGQHLRYFCQSLHACFFADLPTAAAPHVDTTAVATRTTKTTAIKTTTRTHYSCRYCSYDDNRCSHQHQMRVKITGTLFRGPYNKDPTISGTIFRVPYFRKLPNQHPKSLNYQTSTPVLR